MKHYKGFDIKTDNTRDYKYTIWEHLTPVIRCNTIKEYKRYINLIIWSRENIPE